MAYVGVGAEIDLKSGVTKQPLPFGYHSFDNVGRKDMCW